MSKRSKDIVVIATALLTMAIGFCTIVAYMIEKATIDDEMDEALAREFGIDCEPEDSEKHEDVETEF